MSWWVYLENRKAKPWCSYGVPLSEFEPEYEGDKSCNSPCYPIVEVSPHSEGGTHILGGTMSAELNITYNYGSDFYRALGHLPGYDSFSNWLTGKSGAEAESWLEGAVIILGTDRSSDYWASTPGNAGYALSILLQWAKQYPDAVFRVS